MPHLSSPIQKALAVCLVLVVALIGPAGALAQAPSGAGPVDAVVVITLRVQTPAYTLDAAGLRVPGYSTNDAPGAPSLPVWGTVVELPSTGDWSVSVEPGRLELIPLSAPLAAVPMPQPILPGSPGWDDADPPSAVPVIDRPNPAIYRAECVYPASVVQPGGCNGSAAGGCLRCASSRSSITPWRRRCGIIPMCG